jgi:hypothetical protein
VFIKGRTYAPYVYTGAWNSGGFSGVVSGADPASGASLCADGGFTGVVCTDVVVEQTDTMQRVKDVGLVGPGFWLANRDSSGGKIHQLAGGGDSGSPAIKWENSAHTQVGIKGIAIAGDINTLILCNVGDPDLARSCYQRGFYTNISTIRADQNVTLNLIPN